MVLHINTAESVPTNSEYQKPSNGLPRNSEQGVKNVARSLNGRLNSQA